MPELTFTVWMARVDAILSRKIGLNASDMEDYTWRDEHEAGSSPAVAVESALSYWGVDWAM